MVVPFERETVHPHSRGEHNRNHPLRVQPNGSSPLARGAFIISRFRRYVVRFIPTRAGSISHLESPDISISVHPHSRGEHFTPEQFLAALPVHPHSRGEHVC